ncbi:hypothetical protein, partial [Kitasatospora sp. NPDC059571]|uniref:hypothetical protein n=1 Tax=Kitasatospora sp. NPDC059571 TaxID=3346871 RepID=UPI0036C6A64D
MAAEAQRLVNDSCPTFVRNRLPQAAQPDVQRIDGLTFTVLIDQRRFVGNARGRGAPRPPPPQGPRVTPVGGYKSRCGGGVWAGG